ncbi:hypothetical protein [Daejeonella lutea]|uniref:Uncharacterized protein n=1 Tax=Daejeonella lutea TaxID=572036 RepID=A0A1T5B2I2_9SPHI|nr:hypothetical protein [Daejeonella lutea]SKB41424.1 hypothetical protein SAMN05661099_1223 [Daejeonella lutea]
MSKLKILTLVLILLTAQLVRGQKSLEFRFTPKISQKPEIENPSPARITAPTQIAYDMGVTFTHMLNQKWGVGGGITLGSTVYRMDFSAPSSAFGTKQDKGNLDIGYYFYPYKYQGITARGLRNFALNKRTSLRILAEPSLMYYSYSEDNFDGFTDGFNRAVPYDPENPATLPADLLVDIPGTGHRLDLYLAAGLGIERKLSPSSSFVIGVRKSFGLRPIGAGILQVQMNDKLYTGKFNTRAGFFGVDLAYKYSFQKKPESVKQLQMVPATGKYQRVVYGELQGAGMGYSLNYDMRLKPDRKDGFGFRAGLGWEPDEYSGNWTTLPLGINYVLGKRKHGFEMGLGVTFFHNASGANYFIDLYDDEPHPKITSAELFTIGYRYQVSPKLLLRATNSFMYTGKGYFYTPLWEGLSFGYTFNTPKLPPRLPKLTTEKVLDEPAPGRYRKAIFVEGGGNVFGLSANFDMRLRPGRNDGPGFRAGVGYGAVLYEDDYRYFGLAIPLSYNYIFRNERSGIETGLGVTPSFATGNGISNPSLAVVANLGYRLQPLREGLIVRATYSPAYDNRGFRSGLGVSFGYSFR